MEENKNLNPEQNSNPAEPVAAEDSAAAEALRQAVQGGAEKPKKD